MELANRPQLEASFRRRIERLSAKQRKRLKQIAGDPPDLSKVPASFWDDVENEMREQLAIGLLLVFTEASLQHGSSRDGAIARGERFALQRAREVSRLYTDNTIKGFTDGASLMDTMGRRRAAGVAFHETTRARTEGIKQTAEADDESITTDDGDTIPASDRAVLIWTLEVIRKVETHCTFCPAIAGTGEEIWRAFYDAGPPAHFGCACGLTVAPPGTRTRKGPSAELLTAAARDSGVWGY